MEYKGNDFYCDVAIPRKVALDIEYENDHVLAFHHTHPHWPVHIVIVPKQHIDSFLNFDEANEEVFRELFSVIRDIAEKVTKKHGAARILTNLGGYQDSKHLHFHINSGESL